MRLQKQSLLFALFLAFLQILGAALPEGTLISTPHGQIPIERLKPGDMITTPSATHSAGKTVEVHAIESYKSSEIILITTDKGSIFTSASQHFYLANRNVQAPADTIKPKDLLVSLTNGTCKCLSVKTIVQPVIFYELSLASVHEYFAGELQLATHNTFNVSPGLIPAAAAWLINPVIARLSLKQQSTFFTDYEHGKDVVLEQIRSFVHQTKIFKRRYPGTPTSEQASWHLNAPHTCRIEGIPVNSQFLAGMVDSPSLYGPLCATAHLDDDGKVTCAINVYRYLKQDGSREFFSWEEVGKKTVVRGYPIVQEFVRQEDKKQIQQCAAKIMQLPFDAKHLIQGCGGRFAQRVAITKGCGDVSRGLQFGDYFFTSFALQCVVDTKLSPHLILDTIHRGVARPAKRLGLTIFSHINNNACVIVDTQLKQVLALASFLQNEKIDTEPSKGRTKDDGSYVPHPEIQRTDKTPGDLDKLSPDKIKHSIQGSKIHDHKWELLVPDKNWEDIKQIIIEVFETGEIIVDPRYEHIDTFKIIEGHKVIVRRGFDKNKEVKFSGGWIK